MKISVALCTWNGEKFLSDQLDSIFAQTIPVTEIIICDDQSADNTIQIIHQFQQQHPGIIHLVQNKKQFRACKNFEQALQLCTGDIIFLCDQDDRWVKNKVEATANFFIANPKAMGVFTNGNFLVQSKVLEEKTIWGALSFSKFLQKQANPFNLLEMLLQLNNFVTGAALCITNDTKQFIFPFYCPSSHWHDYWVALRIAFKNQLYFLDEKLIHYRVHDSQQTGFSVSRKDNDEASFKEAVWSNQFNSLSTAVAMPFIANALLRCRLYQQHFASGGEDVTRIVNLANELNNNLQLIKKRNFNTLGFVEKKKLLLRSVLNRKKYFYFQLKDLLSLLFG